MCIGCGADEGLENELQNDQSCGIFETANAKCICRKGCVTMKKTVLWLLVFMLPCLCMAETADAEFTDAAWDRDAKEHWHVLENGEKADVAAHVMQDVYCEVCGSEIWLFDDGWANVHNYDEYGELIRATSYDENGEISYDSETVFCYDGNGMKQWEKQYDNGVFVMETVYAVNEDGVNQPVWTESYYDDGTSARNEYDEHGNCIKAYTYDENGAVTSEITSEYALGADGWYYEAKNTTVMDGTVFVNVYNEHHDWVYVSITEADGTVVSEVTFEYEYLDGMKVSCKQFSAGVLTLESYYDEAGVLRKEIEHLEDGTTMVYEFDENGELIHN